MTLAILVPKLMARSRRTEHGCIEVGDPTSPQRYWKIVYDGKKTAAHRAAWEFHKGPIPDGLCVCHFCDNPRCINIDHLFLGTMAVNMADRDAKGRNGTLGENSPLHKLTTEEVLEIFEQGRAGDPPWLLARQFNVSKLTIRRIVAGTSWRWLTSNLQPT